MAKTLMISNEVYDELKRIKDNKSFSETIKDLIARRKDSGKNILKFYGSLKDDKEFDNIAKGLDKEWKKWSRIYA